MISFSAPNESSGAALNNAAAEKERRFQAQVFQPFVGVRSPTGSRCNHAVPRAASHIKANKNKDDDGIIYW